MERLYLSNIEYSFMPRKRDRDKDKGRIRVPVPIIIDTNIPDSGEDKKIRRPYIPPFHKPGIHPPGMPPTWNKDRNYRYLWINKFK